MSQQRTRRAAAIGFLTVIDHPQHGLFGGYLVLNTAGRPLEFHCTAPIKPSRAQEILYGPTLEPYLYGEQIGQTLIGQSQTKPLMVFTDVAPALETVGYVSMPVLLVDVGASDTGPDEMSAGIGAVGQVESVDNAAVFVANRPTNRWGSEAPDGVCRSGDASPVGDSRAGRDRVGESRTRGSVAIDKVVRVDAGHGSVSGLHWLSVGGNRLGLPPEIASRREAIEQQVRTVVGDLDLAEPFQRIRQAIDEAQRGSRG